MGAPSALDPADVRWVAELVQRRSGVVVAPDKGDLVTARLRPLARERGLDGVRELVAHLRGSRDTAAEDRVVEAMTTHETSWFRDGDAIGDLVAAAVAGSRTRRPGAPLRVWSAACSSGQEAYSAAMALAEAGVPAEVTATDVAPAMVERTRAGRYTRLEVERGLPAAHRARHLRADGDGWRVSEALRGVVRARVVNLAAPLPPLGPFDVVLLRNVLLYFDAPTRAAVLDRVARVLAPDGWLLLGAAETAVAPEGSWRRVPLGRGTAHRPLTAPPEPPALPTPRNGRSDACARS